MSYPSIARQFMALGEQRKSLLQKALTSAAGVGEALIPEHLEDVITNTIVRLAPELAIIDPQFDNQKFHEFDRLTSLPAEGGAMGEAAVTPERNANYQRASVQLKVTRRKGSVTNFLQDASANFIDAAAAEMENHLTAHGYDLITYLYYGNKDGVTGNQFMFDGWDKFIATNRFNKASGGEVPESLDELDRLIDENEDRQGSNHRRTFAMSPRMLSKFSRLLANVRLEQSDGRGMGVVEIEGGWRLQTYRNIPIIPTSFTRPKQAMTALGSSAAGAGGAIPNATYRFRVAPITYNGEEIASAERTQATTSNDTLTLTWTAFTKANGAAQGALMYKIYAANAAAPAELFLVRIISAFTYDSQGTITGDVASFQFTSNPVVADASGPVHMQSDIPLVLAAGATLGINPPETVWFLDLDETQGMGRFAYTNESGSRFRGIVTTEPLARTDDNLPFLVKTYGALVDSFQATSALVRGLRIS